MTRSDETAPCTECRAVLDEETRIGGLCITCHRERKALRAAEERLLPRFRERALEASGVPARYTKPFERIKLPRGREAGEWAGEPWAVLITGSEQAGKSMLAVELAWRLVLRSTTPWSRFRWFRASVLARPGAWKAVRDSGDGEVPWVVDDLGCSHTGGRWSLLSESLLYRFDHALPTVFASPLSLRQIAEHDSTLATRLLTCLYLVIPETARQRR